MGVLGVDTWKTMSGGDGLWWRLVKSGHHDGGTSEDHIGVSQEGGMGGHQTADTNISVREKG